MSHLSGTDGIMERDVLSDDELLSALKTNPTDDVKAKIYERFEPDIRGLLAAYYRDLELAKDVTQETFIKFWTCDYGKIQKLRSYLVRMALNDAIDKLRKERRSPVHFAPTDKIAAVSDNRTDPDFLLNACLAEELDRLKTQHREIIVMRYIDGDPRRIVAEKLGLTNAKVLKREEEAKGLLRIRLHNRGVRLAPSIFFDICSGRRGIDSLSAAQQKEVYAACAKIESTLLAKTALFGTGFLAAIKPTALALLSVGLCAISIIAWAKGCSGDAPRLNATGFDGQTSIAMSDVANAQDEAETSETESTRPRDSDSEAIGAETSSISEPENASTLPVPTGLVDLTLTEKHVSGNAQGLNHHAYDEEPWVTLRDIVPERANAIGMHQSKETDVFDYYLTQNECELTFLGPFYVTFESAESEARTAQDPPEYPSHGNVGVVVPLAELKPYQSICVRTRFKYPDSAPGRLRIWGRGLRGGESVESRLRALQSEGFEVHIDYNIAYRFGRLVPAGIVFSQNPWRGEEVPSEVVILSVSSGWPNRSEPIVP